ncbi:MAG: hypothetical protein K8I29_11990 [Alphaproteobacteria bacterium]|uniref:Uncharacterized protein n=1 Tax=Candidatus Nitrobium versatile TaxID=2884831 RepID=A0A953JCA7_9BACT|nr:hypothetical protein [Candidatus Nitrobium versatile]
MVRHQQRSAGFDKRPGEGDEHPERKAEESGGDECRCKEVARKSFPELLRLMLHDLAFWKKAGRPKSG